MNPSTFLASAIGAFTITPSATPLAKETRAIYVGATGSVTVTMQSGESVTLNNLAAGVLHPIRATHVTSATASGIVGFY